MDSVYDSKGRSKDEDGLWGNPKEWRAGDHNLRRAVRLGPKGGWGGGRYEQRIGAEERVGLGVEDLESWEAVMMG